MALDDMKNKISMALQNSIEQLAFEIICKQLDEKDKQIEELKILISSLVYEINQLWDINEINEDLRKHVEKIKREIKEVDK